MSIPRLGNHHGSGGPLMVQAQFVPYHTDTRAHPMLRFRYKNWKGNDHEYVIDPEKIEYGRYSAQGAAIDDETNWVLHGFVVTRDGDLRPDMGPTRRRTFLLCQIRDLEEVERSA